MPSLKELRSRIRSVKSTQKITSAMKMVAVAKLKRAQEKVGTARSFALGLGQMVERLTAHGRLADIPQGEDNHSHLLVLFTSDRGLCGSFNSNLVKEARQKLRTWQSQKVPFAVACLGRKGRDLLRREFQDHMIFEITDLSRRVMTWDEAHEISRELQSLIARLGYTHVTALYARFQSPLIQHLTFQQIIPYVSLTPLEGEEFLYDFLEPSPQALYHDILPENLTAQIYRIALESAASEHGARMTAMDNATRNAKDVIDKLQLNYNRTRQAMITKELIEVISGAEAV